MLKQSIYISIFFLLFAYPFESYGQQKSDKNIQSLFRKAQNYQKKGKEEKAIKNYLKIIDHRPGHIRSLLNLSGIYYNRKDFEAAAGMLEKALLTDPEYDAEIYYSLALIYEKMGELIKAMDQYSNYLKRISPEEKKYKKAEKRIIQLDFIDDALRNPVSFDPKDPGKNINTEALEYLATLNIAGDVMVFSRRINRQEDLYKSQKIDGVWQKAKPISALNTRGNEAAHCLSPDGSTIIFTSCDRRESYGSCDLYISYLTDGQWSPAQLMGPAINSRFWDSQPSITSDGRLMYFSSNRPGGMGGRDIWYSHKDDDGNWSKAKNAGEVINTIGNEESPFIHPDNFTLYFMSDGHIGMGGSDLFVSFFDGSEWETPRNLGYPINTEENEGAIRVAADGETAFFSTDRFNSKTDFKRNLDIYYFTLPQNCRARPVAYVNGYVYNKQNNLPLQIELTLSDNKTGKTIRKLNSSKDGSFIFPIPAGYSYNLWVDHRDFIYHSEHFQPELYHDWSEPLHIQIGLLPKDELGNEEVIILNNVFFDSGSFEIDKEKSKIELENLFSFLNLNKEISIEIRGHTDNIGSREDNLELSEKRAMAIYQFLLEKGIPEQRIRYRGFGEDFPIGDNQTEEGRRTNRRTEFILLSSP